MSLLVSFLVKQSLASGRQDETEWRVAAAAHALKSLRSLSSKAVEHVKSRCGRSSDLFLTAGAFPNPRFSGVVACRPKKGTHSSGTVQDFHLIPF